MDESVESKGRRNFFKTAAKVLGFTAAAGIVEEGLRKDGLINNFLQQKIAEATMSNIAAYAVNVPGEAMGEYMVVDFLDIKGRVEKRVAYFMEQKPVEDKYEDTTDGSIRKTPFTYQGFMNKYFSGFPSSPTERKLLDKLCVDYNKGRPVIGSSVAIPTRIAGATELGEITSYIAKNPDSVRQFVGNTK